MKYLDETGMAYFWNKIKAKIPSVINNLNSTSETDALSANQGKELNNKITEAKGKLLWSNSNPNSSMAAWTEIHLNSSDYDVLEWFYKSTASENELLSSRCLKGFNPKLAQFYCGGSGSVTRDRNVTRNSDTNFAVAEGRYCATGTTARTTDNNLIIPIYVVGYKTGLFG